MTEDRRGRAGNHHHVPRQPHLRLLVPLVLGLGCGPSASATNDATASTTTSEAGEDTDGSSSSSETSSGTESSGDADTSDADTTSDDGVPNPCEACADDEVCVGYEDDACFGTPSPTIQCVPRPEGCEEGQNLCDSPCVEALCPGGFCNGPPCAQGIPVTLWCIWGPGPGACDPWTPMDCPEGEKCAPSDFEHSCAPVTSDKSPGEPCTLEGNFDDCGADSWCLTPTADTQDGECYAFCGGSLEDPTCEGDDVCMILPGASGVCTRACDPLNPTTCGDQELCGWFEWSDTFGCIPGPSDNVPDSECESPTGCPQTQMCVQGESVDGCAGTGCCTDLCDLALPDPCVAPEVCTPLLDPPLVGFESVGVCVLP